MADLTDLQAAETVKVVGVDVTGAETSPVHATAAGELAVVDTVRGSGSYGALTVGTSAVELKVGGSPLTNRKLVIFQNLSNKTIYWGFNSSVTTTTGLAIGGGLEKQFSVNDTVRIWVISANTGLDCRIAEAV